ncbi:MAG: MgtC/SapB family protein [Tissierellia bacterium]|nr:MgtC/SapB family protein [Tissierellia bacterium]
MNTAAIITRLCLAALVGGLIGMEREAQNQPAGLRTHILVCVGSALIMMVSVYVHQSLGAGDPGRIAAQVVSGMGFLGAGTIMVRGFDIKGLTTAASLWVNAGIGLGIGIGFYLGSVVASIIVLIALFFLGKLENRMMHKSYRELILYTRDEKLTFTQMTSIVRNLNIRIKSVRLEPEDPRRKSPMMLHYELFMPFDLEEGIFIQEIEEMSGLERAIYERKLVFNRKD